MALTFELGNSHAMLFDNQTASNDAIWAATRCMVRRMRDEFWGYFGLAVVEGGAYPALTLTPASGGDGQALPVASAQVRSNRGSWQVARGRLEAFVRGSYRLRASLRAFDTHGTLIGMNTIPATDRNWVYNGRIVFNPFTYFRADGSPAIQFSSERARAAHSPTLHLLHELVHLWAPMFTSSEAVADLEQRAVVDVDSAVEGHVGIAQRVNYVGRGRPGMRSYLGRDTPDVPAASSSPAGDWVILPNEGVLQSGR